MSKQEIHSLALRSLYFIVLDVLKTIFRNRIKSSVQLFLVKEGFHLGLFLITWHFFPFRLQWQAADHQKALESELSERQEVEGQLTDTLTWLQKAQEELNEPQAVGAEAIAEQRARHEVSY